jgi:hypothetical protein
VGLPTDRYEWRAHPAPGCAWSWSPGEMVDVMGCLRSHVVSLTWLRVLEIHRVGEVGHRQPPLHRHTTTGRVAPRRQTLSTSSLLIAKLAIRVG